MEVLLITLIDLKTLTIEADSPQILDLFTDSITYLPDSLLPRLKSFTYNCIGGDGDIGLVTQILVNCPVTTFTCRRCFVFESENHDNDPPFVSQHRFEALREIRLHDCIGLSSIDLSFLISACPNLQGFHFFLSDPELEDCPDDYDPETDGLTPLEIISALHPLRNTLQSLSLSSETLGDDNGCPSLRAFTALKHLRLDIFDLIDYDSDDNDDDDNDDDDDEGNDEDDPSLDDPDHIDDETEEVVQDGEEAEWETDSSTEISSSASNSSSEEGDSKCKPFIHLFPSSIETLWLDNVSAIDGDVDDELIKLAMTAKDDFIHLRRITIEGAEAFPCANLQEAFESAGIEFVKKPLHHYWMVEEGLDEPNEPPKESHALPAAYGKRFTEVFEGQFTEYLEDEYEADFSD